jgi:hypothetical protein
MLSAGYDLSILHGGHYSRLGYVRAWNERVYRVHLDQWMIRPLEREVVPLDDTHLADVVSLYNRVYAGYAGTAVRPTYHHLRPDDGFFGWMDENGRLTGYVRAQADADRQYLLCCEAAGDPEICLAVLAEKARQSGRDHLKFSTFPNDHPLLHLIRRGECRVEEDYEVQDGWKVSVINFRSTLKKLCPILQPRLTGSPYADWTGELALISDVEKAGLRMEKGVITVTDGMEIENRIEGGAGIARLLIGSDEPDEIIAQEGMSCFGAAGTLMGILFPNMHPVLCGLDEF